MDGVDGDAQVTLDVFRRAVLAEAAADAESLTSEAEAAAVARIREAKSRADAIVERARAEGTEVADRETARDRTAARRSSREKVLTTRAEAYEELRQRCIEAVRESASLPDLMSRLAGQARSQLGSDIQVVSSGDLEGFVAQANGRRVDYRVLSLVDRAMEELGSELKELWE
jgi:vacuolar-type H+-ATPase subunit E/Vma4